MLQTKLLRYKTPFILLLSFLIPALLTLLIYRALGFSPFGEKSILVMDMAEQNVAFFASLRDIVSGDSSLFFSWAKSFGSNYLGAFAFYVSSPLSFLTLLFPENQLTLALFFLTVLKICLCGLTMSLYLRYGFRKNSFAILLFSVCYAMMSYNFVYSLSLMWLDGVIWLPIILLGIEQILKGKRPLLFLLSLAVMFVSNYYISYMIGIFCVIYFLMRYFSGDRARSVKDFFQKVLSCACAVLMAFGLSAWLTVPTLLDLMQGKIGANPYSPDEMLPFTMSEILSKLLPGQYDTIQYAGLPSVFCGTLILLLAVLYFVSPKIAWKEKLLSAAVVLLFLVSFMVVPVDTVWHVFQAPNWFPYRYAFLFSFLLLYLAYRAVLSLEGACAAVRSRLPKRGKVLTSALVFLLLFGFSTAEMYYNGTAMISGLDEEFGYRDEAEYTAFYDELRPLVEYAQVQGEDFYRIEKDFEYSKNDALTLGYHGITHYSSAYNRNINQTTAKLGFAQTYFWNSYFGSTPVTDSLFGVRYIMSKGELPDFYRPVKQNGSVTLYENPYYLPIGIGAAETLASYPISGCDYFATQNGLLSAIYGGDAAVFERVDFQREGDGKGAVYRFTAESADPCYLSIASYGSVGADIWVNGREIADYYSGETKHCLYIGSFEPGQEVKVEFDVYRGSPSLLSEDIYTLNTERYAAVMTELRQRSLQVSDYRNGAINGTVDMAQDGWLFLSVPYDDGFTVWVDGEKTDCTAYADTFLMLPLSAGKHEIQTSFVSKGFPLGMTLTVITAAFLLLLPLGRYLLKRKREKTA